jgi:hypothetical protein
VRIVAIDPGTKVFGVAVFYDGILERAFLAETNEIRAAVKRVSGDHAMFGIDIVVVEKMQVYRGKTVAADIINVATVAGVIAGAIHYAYGAQMIFYEPRAWKGAIDKATCHDRARAALTPAEIARIELPRAKKTQLDVWDAVSLGLAHLKKTGVRTGRSFVR